MSVGFPTEVGFMKKYLSLLKTIDLFSGIEESDLVSLLSCFSARTSCFSKGETIFQAGESIRHFGIVLSGQVQIVKDDYYGNRNILANFHAGSLIGESFACANVTSIPVSVIAVTDSEVMFIDCHRLAFTCAKACSFHNKLIQNMLNIVSLKNIALTQKIEFTSKRTTSKKLLAYLSSEAKKADSSHFTIPFNRQELADYLCVERSAMSAELSKLRDNGILNFHKNTFELL